MDITKQFEEYLNKNNLSFKKFGDDEWRKNWENFINTELVPRWEEVKNSYLKPEPKVVEVEIKEKSNWEKVSEIINS